MSDLAEILAKNQEEIMKLVAPVIKKSLVYQNTHDFDSETENISVVRTSNPVKNTAISKTVPVNSCNMVTEVLNDFTSNPLKRQNNNAHIANTIKAVLRHQANRKRSSHPMRFQCRKHSLLRYPSLTVSPKRLNFSRTCLGTTQNCTHTKRNNKKSTISTCF